MHDKPILITGTARGGTSMTAGIISNCGVFGGDMYGPNGNNKKGMFENKAIRENILKPYLFSIDADPMGQKPLPDQDKVAIDTKLRDNVIYSLSNEGLQPGQRWFYKGAKMCLIWKAWANAFPDAKWVIVRRPDEQIVSSCLRTSFMRKRKTAEEWQEWVDYHKERFEEMKAYLNCKEVWTHKLVSGDLREIRETLEWLGLEYNKSEILSFVDPTLYTAKS